MEFVQASQKFIDKLTADFALGIENTLEGEIGHKIIKHKYGT